MLEKIKPSAILCYDEPFKSMKGNVIEFLPTTYEWTKNLSPLEQARFKYEKQLRNVIGLNPKDFRYIKYEDPYDKDQMVKCSICGKVALQDQYGNGECKNCGWKFSKDEVSWEKKLGISYPMLVTPTTAREQYKQGKPFKATFEEFVNGLYFYSEMTFMYKGKYYGTFLYKNGDIEFFQNKVPESIQKYKSREEFVSSANINGVLLKDMWDKIENPSFMYCE
jgi:hypothetical protein